MGYNPLIGLVQVGGISIPEKYISIESYIGLESVSDLDSYRSATGILHRDALEHKSYKVELNTLKNLKESEFNEIMNICESAYTVPRERKCVVTAYIPLLRGYVTFDAYMPDANVTINNIRGGIVRLNPVRLAWISY